MTLTTARQPKLTSRCSPDPMKELIAVMNTKQDDREKPYSRANTSRSVPGFPCIRADASGWIYRKRDGQRLKPRVIGGALCVDTSTPTQRNKPWIPVAILVARAFVPIPRPRYRHREVVHLDGDRKNCRASNLAWVRGPRRRQTPILPRQLP